MLPDHITVTLDLCPRFGGEAPFHIGPGQSAGVPRHPKHERREDVTKTKQDGAIAGPSRRRAGSDPGFVVYTADEGLEGEPKVKILPQAEAARRFAASGGRPVDDTIYGAKWDHFYVRRVVGCYGSVDEALAAAWEAGLELQAEVDRRLREELAWAEDGWDRKQVREYYRFHREVHVEFDQGPAGHPVDSEEPIRQMLKHKRKLDAFAALVRWEANGRHD
jgi:hypothetical protein